MAYSLSATKLQAYQRCPQAYYFRYERKLQDLAIFRVAALGQVLHQALARFHGEWHYQEPQLPLTWLKDCWHTYSQSLEGKVQSEGWQILENYYQQFILPNPIARRPIAVEGQVQGHLFTGGLEFALTGRYDRLDVLDDGLELIDYKSVKDPKLPDSDTIDLQLGLYAFALQQHYSSSLRRLSLIFLRQGKKVSFDVTPLHHEAIKTLIGNLATQLRTEAEWQPKPGAQCDRCAYLRYCAAVAERPEPLPVDKQKVRPLQLALQL